MTKYLRLFGFAVLVLGLMGTCPHLTAQATVGEAVSGQDAEIQADVAKALDNKKFKDVKVSSQNGVVTLSGTVALYADKQDADRRVHHRKNVKGVQNLIEVAGPTVDDVTLRD